ncbi:hypothetical protein AAIB41_12270 [Brucella sp. BE17]|uniref:hypothetical protein n=1 Tax=Brucella sp. BE17 TaxID=3142977 RepID=UPI0031BA9171
MPLFSEESRIYDADEVKFMRRCFSQASIILEERNKNYTKTDLSSAIFMLYVKGLRNVDRIANLGSRLATKQYDERYAIPLVTANSNLFSGHTTLL